MRSLRGKSNLKAKRKTKGKAGKAVATSSAPLTLEAFWNELAPAMLPSPSPVPDFMRAEIRRMLAPAIGANPDWERLTDEDDMDYNQLDCEPAGIMAMRWRPGSQVLLTVGVGQNLPVGAGAVGEDLVTWAKKNSLPTLKLTELTENFRLKADVQTEMDLLTGDAKTVTNGTSGIVRAFQAVGRGKVPVAGPGLEIELCDDESKVARKVASLGKKLGA